MPVLLRAAARSAIHSAFGILPSAGLPVGGGGVDNSFLLVLMLCVEGLVTVDEFLKGVVIMLEVT